MIKVIPAFLPIVMATSGAREFEVESTSLNIAVFLANCAYTLAADNFFFQLLVIAFLQ